MPIAAIITDIEGSTSLWEWNPEVMKRALAIHHNVCRLLLPKFHGYESDTEGDSFTLIFHDALDALGWAMEVQRHLLFPLNLFCHMGMLPEGGTSSKSKKSSQSRSHGDDAYSDWPAELLSYGTGAEVADPTNEHRVLYRGLRVRMGIHSGVPERVVAHSNGRQHYRGAVMDMTKAVQDAAASGGQVLMSMAAWQAVGTHFPGIICLHMGLHEVGEKLPPVHLMQMVLEETAHRAPFLPLRSKQLTPSFFDAPCAADCYVHLRAPSDPIVIAFIYVGHAKTLRRRPGYQEGIELLGKLVQELERRFQAYEVEEKEGSYLLAFASAAKASSFALNLQRDAMALPWADDLLEQEDASEVLKPVTASDGTPQPDVLVFRGLRLQIGMCLAVPSDCQPHRATGRAAYFGPIVNRAARIAATAACGQTLANAELVAAARREEGEFIFREKGRFDLKGIKEPMHLFQVCSNSCPSLSSRLFPKTRRLAEFLVTALGLDNDGMPGSPPAADGKLPAPLKGSVSIRNPPPSVHNLVSYDLSLVAKEKEPDYAGMGLDEAVLLIKRYRGEVEALRNLLAQYRRA
eukprot:jgi/Mesvir1/29533/Mv14935-RA.2